MSKKNALPLYIKVKEALKADIEKEVYKNGEKIPTEPELEKIYGASRITIRRAVAELCQEGVLNKQQGSGTFVSEPLQHNLSIGGRFFESFSQACIANGVKPGSKNISMEIIQGTQAEKECLKLPKDALLLHIQRVRTANDLPIFLENLYFSYDEFKDMMNMELGSMSIFRTMQKAAGRSPAGVAYRSIAVTRAGNEQAELLDIPIGEPMLLMKVIYADKEGRPVSIGRQYYVGSRYIFESYDGIILDNIPVQSL